MHRLVELVTYLSDIRRNLANLSQELNSSHPLISGKSSFSGQVMEMSNDSFQDILQARVATLGVDGVDIFGDVVDREIFQTDRSGHG